MRHYERAVRYKGRKYAGIHYQFKTETVQHSELDWLAWLGEINKIISCDAYLSKNGKDYRRWGVMTLRPTKKELNAYFSIAKKRAEGGRPEPFDKTWERFIRATKRAPSLGCWEE